MPVLGPVIGLTTAEEQKVYLSEMIDRLSKSKATTNLFAVSAQKSYGNHVIA